MMDDRLQDQRRLRLESPERVAAPLALRKPSRYPYFKLSKQENHEIPRDIGDMQLEENLCLELLKTVCDYADLGEESCGIVSTLER